MLYSCLMTNEKPIDLSVVVPVFNSENGLRDLYEALKENFPQHQVEFIFVDDSSVDGSWSVLQEIKTQDERVKIFRLAKNFGQHAATLCGFAESSGKWVLTLDDDMEVLPQEASKLLAHASDNVDLIYGEFQAEEPLKRRVMKAIYRKLSKWEGPNKGRGSSFRLIRGNLARTVAERHHHFVFIDEFLLWYTDKLHFVKVNNNPSPLRKSRYATRNLVVTTSKLMMYSTAIPLKLVTRFGFSLAFVNLVIGFWFLRKYLIDKIEVKGYTSLIISVLFSTGVILFCLGIIAQYLRNVLMNLNNAPSYYVKDKSC